MTAITYLTLRSRGFRLHSNDCSHVPHMVIRLDTRSETALEIAPGSQREGSWIVWLRSDIAHSRCRFCFVRDVVSMEQVEALYEAIMGSLLPIEQIDEAQFLAALAAQREECERHYREYVKNERWSYVPG